MRRASATWAMVLGGLFAAANLWAWIGGVEADCNCFGHLIKLGGHPVFIIAIDMCILVLAGRVLRGELRRSAGSARDVVACQD